jgi:hypothetical protein
MEDEEGTPTRDHQDAVSLEKDQDEAVSDQSGETAPAGADEPEKGDDAGD